MFFDSCDGIFTNYNWGEEHLERMRGPAGERLADVYVGVDVFARGNVVGGRFDTNKVGAGPEAGVGGSGPLEASLDEGRSSQRPSREGQAPLSFPEWETEAPGNMGDLPGATLGPGVLAATPLYGQMGRPLEVPGPVPRVPSASCWTIR